MNQEELSQPMINNDNTEVNEYELNEQMNNNNYNEDKELLGGVKSTYQS